MTINDKTSISLFAVFAALPVLVGGLVWLTSIDSKANQALKQTEKIDYIEKALIRIEVKLGTFPVNGRGE